MADYDVYHGSYCITVSTLELLKEAMFTNRSFWTLTSGICWSNVLCECNGERRNGAGFVATNVYDAEAKQNMNMHSGLILLGVTYLLGVTGTDLLNYRHMMLCRTGLRVRPHRTRPARRGKSRRSAVWWRQTERGGQSRRSVISWRAMRCEEKPSS